MMKSLDDLYNLSKETDVDIKLLIREYFQKFILLFLNQINFLFANAPSYLNKTEIIKIKIYNFPLNVKHKLFIGKK